MPVAPMVFFNVGWMENYRGPQHDSRTAGGHAYLKDHKFGAESYNFLDVRGRVYGYRPGGSGPNIDRLGASRKDESITGVTVVWIARHPTFGKNVIVGWYLDATVHRTSRNRPDALSINRERIEFSAEAGSSDARLLDVPQRQFLIPTRKDGRGNLGQKPIWYGRDDEFRRKVMRYISSIDVKKRNNKLFKSGSSSHWQRDLKKRLLVEKRAVEHAISYFESDTGGGFKIDRVERDAKGWDLEARRGKEILLIEVKGCSGNDVCAELTPNEFDKLRSSSTKRRYVVYIVTGCYGITEEDEVTPLAHVFRHGRREGQDVWSSSDGRLLDIREVVAARISAIVES